MSCLHAFMHPVREFSACSQCRGSSSPEGMPMWCKYGTIICTHRGMKKQMLLKRTIGHGLHEKNFWIATWKEVWAFLDESVMLTACRELWCLKKKHMGDYVSISRFTLNSRNGNNDTFSREWLGSKDTILRPWKIVAQICRMALLKFKHFPKQFWQSLDDILSELLVSLTRTIEWIMGKFLPSSQSSCSTKQCKNRQVDVLINHPHGCCYCLASQKRAMETEPHYT